MYLGQAIRELDLEPERLPGELGTPLLGTAGLDPSKVGGLDIPTRVTGWRAWRVCPAHPSGPWVLWSPVFRYVWTAPSAHTPVPPSLNPRGVPHRSGFHLFKSRQPALHLALRLGRRPGNLAALGEAEAFGRVVEHELGYRAHRVVIRRLVVFQSARGFQDLGPVVDSLAQRYECDVDVFGEVEIFGGRAGGHTSHDAGTEWNHFWTAGSDSVATEPDPDEESW